MAVQNVRLLLHVDECVMHAQRVWEDVFCAEMNVVGNVFIWAVERGFNLLRKLL